MGFFNLLDPFFNYIFGWALEYGQLYFLVIIGFIVVLLTTLAQKYLTDQKEIKKLKDESKELSKQARLYKDDPAKVSELTGESFKKSMATMKLSFRPMMYTILPLLFMFAWLRSLYAVGGAFFEMPVVLIAFVKGWLFVYIVISVIFSMILRKVLNVH